MDKGKSIKTAVAVLTAAALCVSSVAAYQQLGNTYVPSGQKRDLQTNQVLFPEDTDTQNSDSGTQEDESAYWEKDQSSDAQGRPQNSQRADYLFEEQQVPDAENRNSLTINKPNTDTQPPQQSNAQQTTVQQPENGNTQAPGYDIIDDKDNADIIISNPTQVPNPLPSNGGNNNNGDSNTPGEDNNGTNPGSSTAEPGASANPTSVPQPTTSPNETEEPQPTTAPTPAPTPRPADTAKDPVLVKPTPRPGSGSDHITNKPYDEDRVPGIGTDDTTGEPIITIMKPYDYGAPSLYAGQTVSAEDIYCLLDTYVVGSDMVTYYWDADAYDKYVRVTGISYDNGKTWIENFPVTLPEDVSDLNVVIRTEYRFSQKGAWREYLVPYTVEQVRFFLLSEQIKEENATIDSSIVLNEGQYPTVGSEENLFYDQKMFLGFNAMVSMDKLFPGWMEHGELVSWFYPIEKGRHILEPADFADVPQGFNIALNSYWMDRDTYDIDFMYKTLVYLQTMKSYTPQYTRMVDWWKSETSETAAVQRLSVPQYVQAIDLDRSEELEVDYLEVPDTVLYINSTAGNLLVGEGYVVDENNPVYVSTEDGMLLNKNKTEIRALPYKVEEISVPNTIQRMDIPANNSLRRIHLEAETEDELPDIDYTYLTDCEVLVQDNLFEQMLLTDGKAFSPESGNTLAKASAPDTMYMVSGGMVYTKEGKLGAVVGAGSSLKLTTAIKSIGENAFALSSDLDTLVIPKEMTSLTLDRNCFAESNIKRVLCSTQAQVDMLSKQLADSGAPEDLLLSLLTTTKDGYEYYTEVNANGEKSGTLLSVPADVTRFDGTVTADDGTEVVITTVGTSAFENCDSLQWAILPEAVTEIGNRAFYGCDALEGVMIETTGTVIIGDESLDNCPSLRFVGSRAYCGYMVNGYDPVVKDNHYSSAYNNYYFYVPTDNIGYSSHCTGFTAESGVADYELVDIGGTYMLYGMDAGSKDEDGNSTPPAPWLALRSGKTVNSEVTLPSTTTELFNYAMADVTSESGAFTVNWEDLSNLYYFDAYSLYKSDLSGDVSVGSEWSMWSIQIAQSAFDSCAGITSVTFVGTLGSIEATAFAYCSNLEKMEFNSMSFWNGAASIPLYAFNGCNALRLLQFNSYTPPELELALTGYDFRFNPSWTEEEELQNLHISIPEGSEGEFIKKWRYPFIGYLDMLDKSAYQYMWDDVQMELLYETMRYPSDEEVDAVMYDRLLTSENRMRAYFGIENATEPTEYFPYRVNEGAGTITLIGSPSNLKNIFVSGDNMGLPSGWSFDYIAEGAFSNAKALEKLYLLDDLVGLNRNMLAGVESENVTIYSFMNSIPELTGFEVGTPFTFGIEDERVSFMVVDFNGDGELQAQYITEWIFPFAGYHDLAEMRGIIANRLLEEKGEEPTDDEIEAVIYEKLLTAENRLRGIMGLELLSDGATLTCGVEPVKKDDGDKDTDTEDKKDEIENPGKAKDAEPSEGTEENGFTGKDAGGTENPDTNVPGTEGTSTTAGETESDSEPEEKATEQPTESGSVSSTADTNEEELSE